MVSGIKYQFHLIFNFHQQKIKNCENMNYELRGKTITIENKVDIIKCFKKVEKVADIARAYKMNLLYECKKNVKDKVHILEHVKAVSFCGSQLSKYHYFGGNGKKFHLVDGSSTTVKNPT